MSQFDERGSYSIKRIEFILFHILLNVRKYFSQDLKIVRIVRSIQLLFNNSKTILLQNIIFVNSIYVYYLEVCGCSTVHYE